MFTRKRFRKLPSTPVDAGGGPDEAMFPPPSFIRPLERRLTARDEETPFPAGRRREIRMSDYLGISRRRSAQRGHRHSSSTNTTSTIWSSDFTPDSPARPPTLGFPGLSEYYDFSYEEVMELGDEWMPLDAPDKMCWHPEGAWEASRIARCHGISSIVIVSVAMSDAREPKTHLLGCHGLSQGETPHWLSRELLHASRKRTTWLPLEDGLSPGAVSSGRVRCFGAKLVAVTCVSSDHGVVEDLFFQQDLETLLEVVSFCGDGVVM